MTKGSSNLTLSDGVEGIWFPGDEIVVATTAQDSNQTERFVIESVNGTVVTVTNVSQYKHIGRNSPNQIDWYLRSFNIWKIKRVQYRICFYVSSTKLYEILCLLLAFNETLYNGETYEMRAEVAVLSHNIRIIGKEYDNIDEEAFGARVIVSFQTDFSDGSVRITKGSGDI